MSQYLSLDQTPHCSRLYLVLIVLVISLIFLERLWLNDSRLKPTPASPRIDKAGSSNLANFDVIVYWTTYFGDDPIGDEQPELNYEVDNQFLRRPSFCHAQFPRCLLTSDHENVKAAKLIIFHWRNLDVEDLPDRNPKNPQEWALFNLESPINTPLIDTSVTPNAYFDLMATYRFDSDVQVPYGSFVPRNVTIATKLATNSTKSKPIAWMVSNCKTQSRREKYAAQLAKHVQVDVYGSCGRLKCARSEKCLRDLERDYFFYLSFENSFCEDYVTEKVYRVMQYKLVPIVYGGANYSRIMPPGSYLNARLYKPEELATLLKSIMADPARYESFFAWKQAFTIQSSDYQERMFCSLCARLEQRSKNASLVKSNRYTLPEANGWFFHSDVCEPSPQI